jgi:hypothetical protein
MDAHYGRKITLFGKEHDVLHVALRDQLDGGFAAENAKKTLEAENNKDQLDLLLAFVKHYVPTATDEDLYSMDMDELFGLVGYIRGEDPDEIASKNFLRAAREMAKAARNELTADA